MKSLLAKLRSVYDTSSGLWLNEVLALAVPADPNGAAINITFNSGINSIHTDAYGAVITAPGNVGMPNIIGALGRYASISGGYDNKNYAQASHISSQHSEIQAGADHAAIFGGSTITISSGSYNIALGGTGNTLASSNSLLGPASNSTLSNATGYSVLLTGVSCSNLGIRSVIFSGVANSIETGCDSSTILNGNNNTLQTAAGYSLAIGRYVIARNPYEVVVSGPRVGTTNGTKQLRTQMVYGAVTTSGTAGSLGPTNGAARVPVAANSTILITADISARRTNTTEEGAGFTLRAVYRRGALANSIVQIGSDVLTVIGRDDATWTCATVVDTTLGSVRISVMGASGKTVEWAASVEVLEILASVA